MPPSFVVRFRSRFLICGALFALALLPSLVMPSPLSAQCTLGWDPTAGVPGADGPVYATAVYDDGNGAALFVGGDFTTIGGVAAPTGLARFDGTTWTAVGTNVLDGGTVRALSVFESALGEGERLYIGGEFFGVGTNFIALVAAYDGTTWDTLAGGMEGSVVSAFQEFDPGTGPRLYAAGSFTTAGGNFSEGIAGWSGTTWVPIGSGAVGGTPQSLGVHDAGSGLELYIGGSFTSIAGVAATNIARTDGATIAPLDVGVNGAVRAIQSFGSNLVVGGEFTQAGITLTSFLATWDGVNWGAPIDAIPDAPVNVLLSASVDGVDQLAIGGAFVTLSGAPTSNIAFWDGSLVTPLGLGADGEVTALTEFAGPGLVPPGLYVGGGFSQVEGLAASGIARYETCLPVIDVLFERGDVNSDGGVNIADAIAHLGILFATGIPVNCEEALDVNQDGSSNIADPVYLLAFLFTANSPAPPAPFGVCGVDTDGDGLDCAFSTNGC